MRACVERGGGEEEARADDYPVCAESEEGGEVWAVGEAACCEDHRCGCGWGYWGCGENAEDGREESEEGQCLGVAVSARFDAYHKTNNYYVSARLFGSGNAYPGH